MSSSERIFLAELTGYTDAGTSQVFRFSTAPYCTLSTDDPPDTRYVPCIATGDAGYIEQRLFDDGKSGARSDGQASVGVGALTLVNIDGQQDFSMFTSGVSFREREYRLLEVDPGASYSTATLVLRACISQVAMTRESVTVSLKDRSYLLASAHLTAVYGGTNVLPAGVDGTAEIAGKLIPLIMGKVFGVDPVCVNTSKLIYQVSSASVQSITPSDGGSTIPADAAGDYTSQADMEANAPAAGKVRVWKAGGMFRLTTAPNFQLLADVTADTAGNSTVGQLIKRLALARGFLAGEVNAADVTALDAFDSSVNGLNINDTTPTNTLMSRLAASIGAVWWPDDLSVVRMQPFAEASGDGVMIAAHNCDSVEKITDGEDVPTLELRLKYAEYPTPLKAGQLATSLTAAQVSDLGEQWRVSRYLGTISPNPYARTQVIERETTLATKTDADAVAARQFNLTKVARRTHRMRCHGDEVFRGATLNGVASLYWDRYGFSTEVASARRITGLLKRFNTRRDIEITGWGS